MHTEQTSMNKRLTANLFGFLVRMKLPREILNDGIHRMGPGLLVAFAGTTLPVRYEAAGWWYDA
jgi:hypothetical protein